MHITGKIQRRIMKAVNRYGFSILNDYRGIHKKSVMRAANNLQDKGLCRVWSVPIPHRIGHRIVYSQFALATLPEMTEEDISRLIMPIAES